MIKLIKISLILFLTLINTNVLHSQINKEWTARYNGPSNNIDDATEIAIDSKGNIYIAGSSYGSGNNEDYIVIKYSETGVQKWLALYNGPGNGPDIANAIAVDDSGNVIVTGGSEGIGSSSDFSTIKYNSLGVQQWEARFTNSGNHRDAAYAIIIDNSGNIYVTGESFDNIGGRDYLTIKYNSSGDEEWMARYDGANNEDKAYAIAIDDSNNIFVSGVSGGDSTTLIDIATIKYSSLGVQQWVARYNGPMNGNDGAFKITTDNEGNVYVCGYTAGAMFYSDYVTLKYNSLGIRKWARIYSGSGNFLDQARDLVVDKSGNIYVTGYATQSGSGYDFSTIKYNANGDQLWLVKYNNGLNDFGNAITIDINENIYITGESDGNGTGYDYATVKYDSSGNQIGVARYNYSGQFGDYPSSIAVDSNGSVYVTGSSNRDILTIKYSQLTGINTLLSGIPSEFKLYQNHPNPFNPKTNIRYSLIENHFVILKVNDVLGNELKTLVNQKQNAGSYKVEFNADGLSSGIYFYSLLIDGNIIDTKRMILLK